TSGETTLNWNGSSARGHNIQPSTTAANRSAPAPPATRGNGLRLCAPVFCSERAVLATACSWLRECRLVSIRAWAPRLVSARGSADCSASVCLPGTANRASQPRQRIRLPQVIPAAGTTAPQTGQLRACPRRTPVGNPATPAPTGAELARTG